MPSAVSASVGPWAVSVDRQIAVVEDTRTGAVFTSAVTLFPVGYRVGMRWSNGLADCTEHIPRRVLSKVRALARRLD